MDRFVQDSGALLHTFMQQTHVIEQHDMPIDEYYSAFDRLMSALPSIVPACTVVPCPTHKFIEKFFNNKFVMGLWVEFDSLRARLLHSFDTLTMARVLSGLFAEETRLKSVFYYWCWFSQCVGHCSDAQEYLFSALWALQKDHSSLRELLC
jgi:hypothetical protein